MSDPRYAVYVVVVEDTNQAYERLSDTGGVDTVERVGSDLAYDEALAIVEDVRDMDQ